MPWIHAQESKPKDRYPAKVELQTMFGGIPVSNGMYILFPRGTQGCNAPGPEGSGRSPAYWQWRR